VLLAHAVVRAKNPHLEVREHQVNRGKVLIRAMSRPVLKKEQLGFIFNPPSSS
jgi:hypothetical protein